MKKICNFRPIAIFGLSLVLGGFCFAVGNFRLWAKIAYFVVLLAIVLTGIIWAIITKKIRFCGIIALCILLPMMLGGILTNNEIKKRLDTETPAGTYMVSGVVKQGGSKQNRYTIVLTDVVVTPATGGGKTTRVVGEIYVSSNLYGENPEVFVGDSIEFEGYYSHTYRKNCEQDPLKMSSSVGFATIKSGYTVTRGSGLKYNILKWSKIKLNDSMDANEADISYAMLFGDKLLLSEEINSAYKITGISHVLAVSGLHIGFLVAIIGFVLKKIIKNKWAYAGVLVSILVFYAYICGWTPSVVRAVIMCGVVLLSGAIFEQYDGLNAIAVAAIINVLISPLNIFNVGFLLSFGVTFSILALSRSITLRLERVMPQKMASSLALSISAWLGSLPVLVFYFKTISTYSVLINFLILPVISILFTVLVVTLALSVIPGTAAVFLAVPKFMIRGLNLFITGVANIKFAMLPISASFLSMAIGMLAIAVMSQYNLIKHRVLYGLVLFGVFISTGIVYTFI